MADASIRQLASACSALTADVIPGQVMEDARLLIVDTLGTLVGGWDSPPARVAQELARGEIGTSKSARVLGEDFPSTVEMAAFANTVAARYLDYNDTYQGVGTGHPSDMLPALLSVAEAEHASGEELLVAAVTGYEAFGSIVKHIKIRDRGWDQGLMIGLGAAAGAAKLLKLSEEQTREALGLAITMSVPLRSTRSGRLFMWKGAATAASDRIGIFAAHLAQAGMTGPDEPIEGRHGLWEQATGHYPFTPFGDPHWIISNTSIKYLPFESNAHGPVDLAFEVREQLEPEQIAHIELSTYWNSVDDIGHEKEKWQPELFTRETAEHSMAFILSVALVDGFITRDSFDDAHIADTRYHDMMKRISIVEDPAFTALWPSEVRSRLTVTTTDGRTLLFDVSWPKGHPKNRGTRDDIEAKFLGNAAGALENTQAHAILDVLARLASTPDVGTVVDAFARERK